MSKHYDGLPGSPAGEPEAKYRSKVEQFFLLLIEKTADEALTWRRHSTTHEVRFTTNIPSDVTVPSVELELRQSSMIMRDHRKKVIDEFYVDREIGAACLVKLYSKAMESAMRHDTLLSSMISALEGMTKENNDALLHPDHSPSQGQSDRRESAQEDGP